MLDTEQLKSELLKTDRVGQERLAKAEKDAAEKGISLTEELASSLVCDFADLGACCSQLTGLPYQALLPQPPSDLALTLMSPTCAAAWETFPVGYEAEGHMLWLAIHDPGQQEKLERIFRFFVQSQRLSFTIAPDVEIARACHKHFGSFSRVDRAPVPQSRLKDEPMQRGAKPDSATAKSGSGSRGSDTSHRKKDKRRTEPSYEEMHRSLVSMITLLVRKEHGDRPEGIHEIRTRVRYCQLLAARRSLTRVQTDAVVLAAWVLGLEDGLSLARQVEMPYRLEAILLADDPVDAQTVKPRVEGQILSLVRTYEDLRKDGELQSRDVSKVRRALQLSWSAAPDVQDLLESFLQILIDDEFLARIGGSDGRILIVDPEEEAQGVLVPSLVRVGYNAISVSDKQSALDEMKVFSPDLVIIEMSHAPTMALRLCESLMGKDGSVAVPVLALVPEGDDQLASQCLRAGAHDFLRSPVNMELLLLKIQTCVSGDGAGSVGGGVSGTLEEMTFTDMIQILCAGRKDLEIVLNRDDIEGQVYISAGDVVHACVGELEGEEAFYALMRWTEGLFSTRRCPKFPERSITSSAVSLLMEGARQEDETVDAPG